MAEIYSGAGGVTDVYRQLTAYFEQRGVQVPKSLGGNADSSSFAVTPAAQALVPPLKHLVSVHLDPVWFAQLGKLWESPLGPIGGNSSGQAIDRLHVTFMDLDDGITETATVNYADNEVLGRSEQFKTYIGAQNRQVSLVFHFRAQGISGVNRLDTIRKEVIAPVRWLDALSQSIESNGVSYAPPPVFLTLGQLLVMRCIAKDVQITWGETMDPTTFLPLSARVSVTFEAVTAKMGNYNFDGPERFKKNESLEGGYGQPAGANTNPQV